MIHDGKPKHDDQRQFNVLCVNKVYGSKTLRYTTFTRVYTVQCTQYSTQGRITVWAKSNSQINCVC